jgi:TolA-binding protein
MRNPLFQLVGSGVLLGLMCGAVMIHAIQVRKAEHIAGNELGSSMRAGPTVQYPAGELNFIVTSGSEKGTSLNASASREEKSVTVDALKKIVEQLQELDSRNQELQGNNVKLQEQLKETNRDLNELQFRVDTHSESFRPLKTSSGSGLVFRNSMSPGGLLHPLLPPKQ